MQKLISDIPNDVLDVRNLLTNILDLVRHVCYLILDILNEIVYIQKLIPDIRLVVLVASDRR